MKPVRNHTDKLLLKTISLRQFYVAHIKVQIPVRLCPLDILSTPFSQFLNIFETLTDGGILKVYWMVLQIGFVKEQSKNKWFIFSIESQKTHFLRPFQKEIARLPFVRITFL
jgi:hypothetical protein